MMDIEYLLTDTRSARKSLDLDAPVDLADIRECLRVGLQAANGSNAQDWRWLVVARPARCGQRSPSCTASPICCASGGELFADQMPGRYPGKPADVIDGVAGRQNMAKVPLLVIPCYEAYLPRIDGDESFHQATLYGSIFPPVWNFQLALHTRGYGTVHHHAALALRSRSPATAGYPGDLHPGLPAARGAATRRAHVPSRPPVGPSSEVVTLDRWDGPRRFRMGRHRCKQRLSAGRVSLIAFTKDLVRVSFAGRTG